MIYSCRYNLADTLDSISASQFYSKPIEDIYTFPAARTTDQQLQVFR